MLFGDIYSSDAEESVDSIVGQTNPLLTNRLRLYVSYQCSGSERMISRYLLDEHRVSLCSSQRIALQWDLLCLCASPRDYRGPLGLFEFGRH